MCALESQSVIHWGKIRKHIISEPNTRTLNTTSFEMRRDWHYLRLLRKTTPRI